VIERNYKPIVYTCDTVLKFGKHKGKTVKEIMKSLNASYLVWCKNNIESFILDESIRKDIEEQAFKESENWKIQQAYTRSYGNNSYDDDYDDDAEWGYWGNEW